jgi:hypothetical protein
MTTVTQFQPSNVAPFQFQPTLDNATYNAVVTWNLFGRRWYFNLYQLDGTLVVYLPLIGSTDGIRIASMIWANGIVTVTTAEPHGYEINRVIWLTMVGCLPDAYNGRLKRLITGPNTFSYGLPVDPGDFTQLGIVSYDTSLVAGYFDTSTLVFRQSSQTFEVSPYYDRRSRASCAAGVYEPASDICQHVQGPGARWRIEC